MGKKYKYWLVVLLIAVVTVGGYFYLKDTNVAVLNSKGVIADKQRSLMIFTVLLSLLVVIPVFIMTFYISWKYRASNVKAKYTPDWDGSRNAESIWWGIPLLLIAVLAVVTWKSTHELDPYKELASSKKPINVQVVALQWKWLFIYPDQDIASVNYLQFPEDTPVNFKITSDAPMNSFWIPQLGGQIYAMAGMESQLHLMANEQGTYDGVSANLSGEGFAGMKFKARASSQTEFDNWVKQSKASGDVLSMEEYSQLVKPSQNNVAVSYSTRDPQLYDRVIGKYMAHGKSSHGHEDGADH